MLKKGAYAALMEDSTEGEDEAKQFCDEDIDSILARRTQVIRRGPEEDKKVVEDQQQEEQADGVVKTDGSLFSKATFSLGESTSAEHDLEDPNFWDTWAKKANLDPTALAEEHALHDKHLIVEEPRRRKKVERPSNMMDNTSVDGDDDESKGRSSRKPASGPVMWTMAERSRLERGLMLYGFGAWEKKVQNFPRRSINDIKSAEHRLLSWCSDRMKESLKERKGANVDKKEKTPAKVSAENKRKSGVGREDSRILREDERIVEDIDKMVKCMQWDIPVLEDVEKMALDGCKESFKASEYELQVDPELGPYPYPGATTEKLLAHRSLIDECPRDYLDTLNKKKRNLLLRVQMIHFLRQEILVIDPHAVTEVWTRKAAITPNESPSGDSTPPLEEKSVIVDKYDPLYIAVRTKHEFPVSYHGSHHAQGAPEGSSIPTASVGSFNYDWWTEEQDRDLVVGSIKWGYQSYDQIRADPELCFSQWKWKLPITEKQAEKAATTSTTDVESGSPGPEDEDMKPWPSGSDLGVRIRRLIHIYKLQMREEEAPVVKVPVVRVESETSDKDHQWSKRDRAEFLKLVNYWGVPEETIVTTTANEAIRKTWLVIKRLPDSEEVQVNRRDWTDFKQTSGLNHKPDFAVEVFFQAFLKRLEELSSPEHPELESLERAGGILLWGSSRSRSDSTAMDVDNEGSESTSAANEANDREAELAAHLTTKDFAVSGTVPPKDWNGNQLDICEGIPADKAYRTLRRVCLLHSLRRSVLADPALDTKLERARRFVGLPDWWQGKDFDSALLVGVSKHGMGPLQQHRIITDPELPFRSEAERIFEEIGLSVNVDELEDKRKVIKKGDKKPETNPEDDMLDDVRDADLLSGDIILEDVIGWPRDIIRSRRIEHIVELVLSGGPSPTMVSGRHKRKSDGDELTASKKQRDH